jgi:peptidyl-tRNA hydrolase
MSAADYVLQDFSAAEVDLLTPTLERAVDAILTFVTEGLETAMNQYNGTL